MTTIHKTLLDILESHSFERLKPFKQPSVWKKFDKEERILLARLFVLEGSRELVDHHRNLKSSKFASQNPPKDSEIAQYSYRDKIQCLILASEVFADILQQDSRCFKSWYLRAQVLMDIGIFEHEASYLAEAHQHFAKAYALLATIQEEINFEKFYWKWGFCLSSLGKISGEPLDFYQSIDQYRLAYELGCREARFLNEFGHGFANTAALLDNPDYFMQALKLFNEAIHQEPEDFEGWYSQACCLQKIMEFTYHDKYLEQADQSFAKASVINPLFSQLWLNWGLLDMTIGKMKRNSHRLEASLVKFSKGNELEPNHPEILSYWAEAELCLGVQEERLDLIQSARTRIMNSLEIESTNPNAWYLYGSCLNELGDYFNEESYYHQAIEKFQYGLSLKRQFPILWYGLALANFALGELAGQGNCIEKSLRYFSRFVEYDEMGFPQFWNDWGVALVKFGEMTHQSSYIEMALEKFERALKQPIQNIENPDVDLEWIYNYGCAFDFLGDLKEEPSYFEKAVCILAQVLKLDPLYTQARFNLALALSHLAEATFDVECYYKAAEHFQYLLDQDPEDEITHLEFGVTLTNLALLIQDIHHPERSQTVLRQAETHFLQAATLGNTQVYYQLAGLYSIIGHHDHAMHYLERSQFMGTLPGIEDLLHDEWLEGLRPSPAFQEFINELSSQQESIEEKYE